MLSAEARCPASCGELIQGWIGGSEKLVSCPVDWFSDVTVTYGSPSGQERPLMRAMINQVVRLLDFPEGHGNRLSLRWQSTIPQACGMASSTADIAAAAQATARLLGHELTVQQLVDLCVALEPTDSTLFPALTLFDHLNGQSATPCPPPPAMDVLVLESDQRLTTAEYHLLDRQWSLQKYAPKLEQAWERLYAGCLTANPHLIGTATTQSAIASQHILVKPGFDGLLGVVERFDLFGLVVAHSGTVAGLLLNRSRHDVEEIKTALKRARLTAFYPRQHLLAMVPGGVR